MSTIPEHILDDLSSRFIVNIPKEEREDIIRIMFQVELAHWFYLDLHCADKGAGLPNKQFKPFCVDLFAHVPFLRTYLDKMDLVCDEFRTYKQQVPTYGGIILDHTMEWVLLVQGFYSKASWGFPKGKVNEGEEAMHCAIREVLEETGFDCRPYIRADKFIEKRIHGTMVRLYIVRNVSKEEVFNPQTRGEIRDIAWHEINTLPEVKTDPGANRYFMVMPFLSDLKRFIQEEQRPKKKQKKSETKKLFNPHADTPPATPQPAFTILKRQTPTESPGPKSKSTKGRRANKQSIAIDPSNFSDSLTTAASVSTARTVTTSKSIDVLSLFGTAQPKAQPARERFRFGSKLWDSFELNVDWPSVWADVANEMENPRPGRSR